MKGVGMVTSCPPKVFSEFGKWPERNITGEYSNVIGINKRWLGA